MILSTQSSFDLFKLNFDNVLVLAFAVLCYLRCFAIDIVIEKNCHYE